MSQPPAVVLVSGGLDSATALAVAQDRGFDCHALSFDYGQRHAIELEAARRVCNAAGVAAHVVVPLDVRAFGGSSLVGDGEVPKGRDESQVAVGIPSTYVPARNTVFLSVALGWAETLGAFDLFAGLNAVDYSGYPDCRPAFVEAFERLANLATKAGVEGAGRYRVHAPLIELTKPAVIRLGAGLGVDYSLTHSCYDPDADGRACGGCDSCVLRRRGFEEAGVPDPTRYTG